MSSSDSEKNSPGFCTHTAAKSTVLCEAVATQRVLARELKQAMRKQQKTKQAMARELHTSRSQLDRLLDPRNTAVSLDTITRAAKVLGKRVILRIANPRMAHQRSRSARKASAR